MKLNNISFKKHMIPNLTSPIAVTALLLSSLLVACSGEDGADPTLLSDNPSMDMGIPESLTGGSASAVPALAMATDTMTSASSSIRMAKAGVGQPCSYLGNEDEDDPFRNGYETSKFMISIMASWTCIADLLIDVSSYVPHDGTIIETENDTNSDDFEADEPTHYSVIDDSETQVTVRLYYNYSRSQPPVAGEQAQFYVSWNEAENGDIEGRMIIDGDGVAWDNHDSEDPSMMRMDFFYTDTQQTADMFLQFDEDNLWADGFRIQIVKDLDSNPLLKVFEARGLIDMKAQFAPVANVTEIPDVQLYTVSDALGNGASIAEFQDLSLPLELNANLGNNLGNYIFTKKDVYFFEYDMDWEYIHKTVLSSEYRGARTTPVSGGTWLPFDPSLDLIITALSLDSDYFTGAKCAVIGDDCNGLLNAVFDFSGGFAGQEENQGTDPLDWRSTAISNVEYLTTVYPNGVDWTGAFEHSFTPSENP
ncbi:MAG: hypothetical protein HKP22_05305 [Gammaproteobacteria bacterium]|nr:hypothetical protein [Gammaproteobacteria bacterium]